MTLGGGKQCYFISEVITYRADTDGILIDEVLPIQCCDRNSLCAESVKLGNKKKKKKIDLCWEEREGQNVINGTVKCSVI